MASVSRPCCWANGINGFTGGGAGNAVLLNQCIALYATTSLCSRSSEWPAFWTTSTGAVGKKARRSSWTSSNGTVESESPHMNMTSAPESASPSYSFWLPESLMSRTLLIQAFVYFSGSLQNICAFCSAACRHLSASVPSGSKSMDVRFMKRENLETVVAAGMCNARATFRHWIPQRCDRLSVHSPAGATRSERTTLCGNCLANSMAMIPPMENPTRQNFFSE
mmetsp:Transcript_55083/g.144880  ORF Transcript_55083/g.144880 Transcript_55083/m.144880 type:complete len:223 (+) Transcript_55083:258-926(+)